MTETIMTRDFKKMKKKKKEENSNPKTTTWAPNHSFLY